MSTYAWPQAPGWWPNRFEMRVLPNTFVFTSQYGKSTQAVDLLGERWRIVLDLPALTDPVLGAAREAFFDRLKGPVNLISIGHLLRTAPQGTVRGAPTLSSAVAQLGNIASIQTTAFATLRAGDHLGLGAAGQLVRVMADAQADGAGLMSIEFYPRARTLIAANSAVAWAYPQANFRLAADGVPVAWVPGANDGSTLELIEAV